MAISIGILLTFGGIVIGGLLAAAAVAFIAVMMIN